MIDNPNISRAMASPPDDDDDENGGTGTGLATRTLTRTRHPTPYRVLMLNDDYTPMEFVVLCLQRFFRMSIEEATRVMLHVHQRGVGRSEEHTSELQYLMRNSYAVFCLKKNTTTTPPSIHNAFN